MSEEGTPTTNEETSATPAESGGENTPAVETSKTPVEGAENEGQKDTASDDEASLKPFLGGKEAKEKEAKAEVSDEDYIKTVVKDEEVLGKDSKMELDASLVKALAPKAKELGVSPEQMKALANHLAKAQIEQSKEYAKSRIEYFEKMKQESLQKYTTKDFEQINRGIDKWFKPNGVMNNVIRNSELGADPEFLALMHYLGEAVKEDGLSGAGSGSGAGGGDGNGIDGLSNLW